jgi:endonuclease YncB( thermonuclease family)
MSGEPLNIVAACIVALSAGLAVAAEPIKGTAEVVDGDTIRIEGTSVRLWGIDAPEGRQECVKRGKLWLPSSEATEVLRGLLSASVLVCEPRHRDRNGRTVALCRAGGIDVGGEMVRLGWARDFLNYSGGFYAKLEAEAQSARRGIWAAKCDAPWVWRAERR